MTFLRSNDNTAGFSKEPFSPALGKLVDHFGYNESALRDNSARRSRASENSCRKSTSPFFDARSIRDKLGCAPEQILEKDERIIVEGTRISPKADETIPAWKRTFPFSEIPRKEFVISLGGTLLRGSPSKSRNF